MAKHFWLAGALALILAGCSSPRTAASVVADAQEAIGNPGSIQSPARA
jgi:hypothetical protein